MGMHCEFSLSGSRIKPDDGGMGPTIGCSGPRRPYVLGMSTTYMAFTCHKAKCKH
jgi:hypothetical protein